MALPTSIDVISELQSLMNSILLIGCRLDAANSEMIVGRDKNETKSGGSSMTVTWYPEECFEGEVS